MPLYDYRCENCLNQWEQQYPSSAALNDTPECPECGSQFTKQVWSVFPSADRAKDPYDYLETYRPPGKAIKSFANDRRKGGKDTT